MDPDQPPSPTSPQQTSDPDRLRASESAHHALPEGTPESFVRLSLLAWLFLSTFAVFALFVDHDLIVDEGNGRYWVKIEADRSAIFMGSFLAATVTTLVGVVLAFVVRRLAVRVGARR